MVEFKVGYGRWKRRDELKLQFAVGEPARREHAKEDSSVISAKKFKGDDFTNFSSTVQMAVAIQ